ncbi:MAG: hypothetical protein QCH35_07310 [Methanomicrobiaceae archaeon]|nr:hypothetical protein [Methanomicrobiaceae archaeon]
MMRESSCSLSFVAYFLFIFPFLGIDPGVVLMEGITNFIACVQSLLPV